MRKGNTLLAMFLHTKCRGTVYPRTNNTTQRFPTPDDKVDWSIPFPEYDPPEFTAEHVIKGPSWADRDITNLHAQWNSVDGPVNRVSHTGTYKIGSDGRPLNPFGRTGLKGRGVLGRWGPNHAADPIVTRWKRTAADEIIKDSNSGLPVLQFVAILRGDCGEWALPGGMVDAGEKVSQTLQREFIEEAMDSVDPTQVDKIKTFFSMGGTDVYRGYVDDPRNTDNAWMETVAVNFHDEQGDIFGNVSLHAGDDAVGVTWRDLSQQLNLYASHTMFLQKVAKCLSAHW